MTRQQKAASKAIDARVMRAYYATCCGIPVNIMDLSKISAVGRAALADDIDDAELGRRIRAYVDTLTTDRGAS